MCGIFGVLNYSGEKCNLSDVIESLACNSVSRGHDATGISYIRNNKIEVMKKPVPSYNFNFNSIYKNSDIYMGHVRLATRGVPANNYNNHPFLSIRRKFALAHNGILWNTEDTKIKLGIQDNKIETDTYLAVQILDQYSDINSGTIKKMCESVEGDFLFTILDKKGNIYFARNNNPITIYDFYNIGIIVYASTQDILNNVISEFVELRDEKKRKRYATTILKDGDILKITNTGNYEYGSFEPFEFDTELYIQDLEKRYNTYTCDTIPCDICDEDNCNDCTKYDVFGKIDKYGGYY